MTPERRALFLAGQHCQGGHSAAGDAIAEALGVPFPLRMTDLIAKLREEGQNPAAYYPWLIRAHGVVYGAERGRHPFFTDAELAEARGPRDPTKLDARALTDSELIAEQTRVEKVWDEMHEPDEDGEIFAGHGGSPGEWMVERMDEIATEQARRAARAQVAG